MKRQPSTISAAEQRALFAYLEEVAYSKGATKLNLEMVPEQHGMQPWSYVDGFSKEAADEFAKMIKVEGGQCTVIRSTMPKYAVRFQFLPGTCNRLPSK